MTHQAKAPSAGSTQATGNSRGLFRRAFATRVAPGGSKGTSAPSSRRARATLAVLALAIAAFAITAAPASAAPLAAKMETISNVSYTSAHVTGKLSSPCKTLCSTAYNFQYATSESGPWNPGPGGSFLAFAFPDGLENQPVQGDFEQAQGLKGGTKYFVRLTASTFVGGESLEATDPTAPPYQSFTTLAVDPPTIPGAVEASPVFSTSATATAKVKRPANADAAFDVNCHFEYITDAQYEDNVTNIGPGAGFNGATPAPCAENPIDKADLDAEPETKVTAALTGLSPATAYRLRLVAENAAPDVVTKEAPATFTTEPPVAKPTVLATDNATDPTVHEAKASGEVQRPAGDDPALDTSCRFEYVTDQQFNDNPPGEEFTGATPVPCQQTEAGPITSPDGLAINAPVSAELTGLKPATTYHLRLAAENGGGTEAKDATATFTTLPAELPIVTIDPVAGGTYTTAHVSGTVDVDDAGKTEAQGAIEVSTDGGMTWPGLLSARTSGSAIRGESGVTVFEHDFTGLQPNTTYTFRAAATYNGDYSFAEANGEVAYSAEETITTEPATPPTAADLEVTNITATTAHFTGTVNPNAPAGPLSGPAKKAFATNWHFECAPECKDVNGNEIGGTIQGEEGSKAVAGDVKRLDPNTEYEVRLIVSSEGGDDTETETFPTLEIPPTVKQAPGGSDGKGGYVLQGTVNPNGSPVSDCFFAWGPDAGTEPKDYAFKAPCSPMPKGRDAVQGIGIDAIEGQFKLSYGNQTTNDLPFDATPAEVEAALKALSTIGPADIAVTGSPGSYKVTFEGSLAGTNVPLIRGESGTNPLGTDPGKTGGGPGQGTVNVSFTTVGGNAKPVTVEAPLTGLTPDAIYNFRIFATNAAGTEKSENLTFKPTLATKEPCANEQIRTENSSLALPECRAYEMVSPPEKEGWDARLYDYSGGDRVNYRSGAANIAKSGQGVAGSSSYVTVRSTAGWETIPNLNGSSGSLRDAPSYLTGPDTPLAYSSDLLSSLWRVARKDDPPGKNFYLRNPDGTFTFIAPPHGAAGSYMAGSADLSHLVLWTSYAGGSLVWGPGVYDFVGTGVAQPRRVDVDNLGSPISTCTYPIQGGGGGAGFNASGQFISNDGRVIVVSVAGLCGGANPPAEEIWARVGGTTSVDVSASRCDRTAADPGGACNGPVGDGACSNAPDGEAGSGCRNLRFQGAAKDGSRVFFTTKRQLLDADTDETADLYACDIPSGTPAPVGKANHCSTLRQVSSGALTGADVESVGTTSEDGSTVLFTAEGVLADNEDALKEKAVAGDHNLYTWRTDAAHPAGQTRFVARLDSNDIASAQSTPDGRYLVFTTASQLVATDTDNARDVYRYDADSGQLTRASTNVFGVAGNGSFDAQINGRTDHHSTTAISDDGQKIVFTTAEALSPVDGNGEPDAYLWTPNRVSLISSGSVGGAVIFGGKTNNAVAISGSGQDIYFNTTGALTPADGDDIGDVYDARIGGGFSFAPKPFCTGEDCQPGATPAPLKKAPLSALPGPGNPPQPKPCTKGKVRNKKGKCVPKHKKHHKKSHKKAGHNRGGSK